MNKGGHLHFVHNNGSRGRWSYGLMSLLAFVVAISGVMVIHKLRERRIFNLMVKEKDRQLITLHLLLQKEREYGKEAKSNLEEMKAKLRTLRIQKSDLVSRILEMQSTISSLKDGQTTIELALEEKQNEIKQMRDNYAGNTGDENNQGHEDLSEMLRQKEAEIKDLKHRLELPVKVWSLSADDPANSTVNANSIVGRDETMVNERKKESAKLQEIIDSELAKNSTQEPGIIGDESANNTSDNGENNRQVIAERSEMTGGEESNNEVQKRGDEEHGGHATVQNELEATANDQPRDGMEANYKGGTKSEMAENIQGELRGRGKIHYTRRIRGKRRRITAKSREITENSSVGLAGMRATGFPKSTYESERHRRARDEKLGSFDQKDLNMDSSGRSETENHPEGEELKMKINEQVGLEHGKGNKNSDENSSDNYTNNTEDSPPGTMSNTRENLDDEDEMRQEGANNIILNSENNGTSMEARPQKPDHCKIRKTSHHPTK